MICDFQQCGSCTVAVVSWLNLIQYVFQIAVIRNGLRSKFPRLLYFSQVHKSKQHEMHFASFHTFQDGDNLTVGRLTMVCEFYIMSSVQKHVSMSANATSPNVDGFFYTIR